MVTKRERSGEPDFAILVAGAMRVVADRLQDAMAAAGHDEMRPRFGFVVRALAEGGVTLTDLAGRLGVSKQTAIKLVDEMEAHGLLVREAHATDRRAKVLVLTERGRSVRATALRESERMERELRRELGDADVDALRRALGAFSASSAGGPARPVW